MVDLDDIADELYNRLFRVGRHLNSRVPIDPKQTIVNAIRLAAKAGVEHDRINDKDR